MIRRIPKKIDIRTMHSGKAGMLSFLEANNDLPFAIRRMYYIYGGEEGRNRGFHAHKSLWQCLVVVQGSLTLKLEGKEGSFSFPLSEADSGVIIPPGYWREMLNMTKNAIVLVLASANYTEEDYIRNYEDFQNWLAQEPARPVPYIDFTRYISDYGVEIECAVSDVVRSGHYINGPQLKTFENNFSSVCGAEHVVGVGNGLSALTLILEALEIGHGDDVLVCAAGFVATPLAVSRRGAFPVFVETLPNGNINPAAIEEAITPASKAILLTHLYGNPADMAPINRIAEKYGLYVIEDACQAHGATYKGQPCGSLGTAAAFSFYPTKNLGGIGDAGCVATNDAELAQKIRKIANYGSSTKYHHEIFGENSRLDELQAAVLNTKLRHLHKWNHRRALLARIYNERLVGIPDIVLPDVNEDAESVWHVYAIRVKNGQRNTLRDYLESRGIGTNIHYPIALHKQQCYAQSHAGLSFPEAEAQAEEVLSLPLDAMHRDDEIVRVCDAVCDFLKKETV